MINIATPNFMLAGVLWAALAVVWLLGNRRLSCWPVTWKEYFWPVAPAVMLGLAWLFAALGVRLPFDTLFRVGIVMWAFLTLVWLASILKRDSSIMDIAYALCAVLMLWAQWGLQGGDLSPRSLLMLVIVNLWGWRYTVYIAWRNLPHGEDRRYARWRERTGAPWWWWSYFQVFLLQAVLIWLWYAPIALAMAVPGPLGALEFIAALVWVVGFIFEAGADWQLARFKGDPANRGTGYDEPMLMVLTFGKGRIFHTTLGHDTDAMACAGFITTLQRGAEWAATGKVTQKVPKDVPSADKESVRP